jgi:hypothetical protein
LWNRLWIASEKSRFESSLHRREEKEVEEETLSMGEDMGKRRRCGVMGLGVG